MSAPADYLLSLDQERVLHQRLVDEDVTAPVDLMTVFLEPLIAWLRRHNDTSVPDEFCVDAAEDALMNLAKTPRSFDPARGKRLWAYLQMSAQGDLRNALQQESRRRRKEKSLEAVELAGEDGKYLGREDDPALSLQIREESEQAIQQVVGPVRDGLSEAESRAFDLLLEGERKTAAFAAAMGIEHLPKEEQEAEVKRTKDKLKKRIERARDHVSTEEAT
jgi:hypothetical protein